MGFRSIRWQLQLWYSVFSAMLVAAILLLFHVVQERSYLTALDAHLQMQLVNLLPIVLPPQGLNGPLTLPEEEREKVLREFADNEHFLVLWDQNGREIQTLGQVPHGHARTEPFPPKNSTEFRHHEGYREICFMHPTGRQIIIGVPHDAFSNTGISKLQQVAIALAIMLVGVVGGWIISGKALRPIGEMGKTAREIANGELDRRARLMNAPEELQDLAAVLNQSYDHLTDSMASQKCFAADASHELRTPVSIVLAQATTALSAERTPAEYRSALEACQRSARRMKRLVTDLLDLSRMDADMDSLSTTPTDLRQLIEAAVVSARTLSMDHTVELILPETECMLAVDPDRMFRALLNLINNSIKHNPSGYTVSVSLRVESKNAVIEVADDGVGFDMHAHPQIFERFYRVDKSRSRQQGGSGLGLAIARTIVEAHGGTITATSHVNNGAVFTSHLPREEEASSR